MATLALLCLVSLSFSLADEASLVLTYGPIQGNVLENAREFAGVPFAAPPIGALRWQDPQAKANWGPSVLNTQAFSPGCPQECALPPHTCPNATSEDCLYLNIWTPRAANITQPLPVMVFVHGGNFVQGAGGTPIYNSTYIAASQNVIAVTVNYRLGALGWLASTTLPGNYGFKDQIFALQWIQNNIAVFGGDANSVTIYGQSAGGTSMAAHLTSDKSDTYFHKAIVHSDPWGLYLKTPAQFEDLQVKFAFYLNCSKNDWDCQRAASINDVLAAQDFAENTLQDEPNVLALFYPWAPVIDGVYLTDQPITNFYNGKYQKQKPLIMGTVLEEGWLFVWEIFPTTNATYGEYTAAVKNIFGANTYKVLSYYPPLPADMDQKPIAATLATDLLFYCPTRYAAQGVNKQNVAPVYIYRFDQIISFDAWGDVNPYCVGHVCHGSELAYVFHSWTYDNSGFTVTDEEQRLADTMTIYWANFAKTGNPNTPVPLNPNSDFINWPQYNIQTDQIITMNVTFGIGKNYKKSDCDMFDSLGPIPYVDMAGGS